MHPAQGSIKYCEVAKLHRGVRVYTISAMCMPDKETALEELMYRIWGNFLVEDEPTKTANGLFSGDNSHDELL